MKKQKFKLILLCVFTFILLAGVITISYAVFRSASKEEISYETGAVKLVYNKGTTLKFTKLKKGDIIRGDLVSGVYKPIMSFTNNSTVPVKIIVTITLKDIDDTAIVGSRKNLIEGLFKNSNGEFGPASPFVKDTSASSGNKLVYVANNVDRGTYELFNLLEFKSSLTNDELDTIGKFKLSINAVAEQVSVNNSYKYEAKTLSNLLPGAYFKNLGVVSVEDENNTLNRPVIVREKVSGKIVFSDGKSEVINDENFNIVLGDDWVKYEDYYYYLNSLESDEETPALFKELMLPENLSNKYQNADINLTFDKEIIDCDPFVRPSDWPSDEKVKFNDDKCKIKINITNCPQEELKVGDTVELNVETNQSSNLGNLIWNNSNTDVVKLSDGEVQALKGGTATISVNGFNGNNSTCVITVKKDIKVEESPVTVDNSTLYIVESVIAGVALIGCVAYFLIKNKK